MIVNLPEMYPHVNSKNVALDILCDWMEKHPHTWVSPLDLGIIMLGSSRGMIDHRQSNPFSSAWSYLMRVRAMEKRAVGANKWEYRLVKRPTNRYSVIEWEEGRPLDYTIIVYENGKEIDRYKDWGLEPAKEKSKDVGI